MDEEGEEVLRTNPFETDWGWIKPTSSLEVGYDWTKA
jgi:hypothetical protein